MRNHSASCLCDICYRRKNPEAAWDQDQRRALVQHEANEKRKKIAQVIKDLGIPMDTEYSILSSELYDIFMDDEKCEALISKLKNKAFW